MKVNGHLGSVEFDGQQVTIRKKLRGAVTIPLSAVQSVSLIPAGIGMSGIRFAVAGGSLAGASVAIGVHKDVAQDPYAVTFRNGKKSDFQTLASAIDAARFAVLTPAPVPVMSGPQDAPSFPAGWYPEGGRQRYWDGRNWTQHYA
jgi:hypothetical protein